MTRTGFQGRCLTPESSRQDVSELVRGVRELGELAGQQKPVCSPMLREEVDRRAPRHTFIHTRYGVGYKLEAEPK